MNQATSSLWLFSPLPVTARQKANRATPPHMVDDELSSTGSNQRELVAVNIESLLTASDHEQRRQERLLYTMG